MVLLVVRENNIAVYDPGERPIVCLPNSFLSIIPVKCHLLCQCKLQARVLKVKWLSVHHAQISLYTRIHHKFVSCFSATNEMALELQFTM